MRAPLGLFALAAALSLGAFGFGGASSEVVAKNQQRDFIIAGSDGYGTQECLEAKGRCGQVVADAWCESKGFKGALAYRQLAADEITGSTSASFTNGKPPESFLISCRE